MSSLISGFEYDIFISYRQKDNKGDRWVSEFVEYLKNELEATFKEEISVYFDVNPHDGLLETHDVGASLKEKLKCLVFIPIISQTYCDPKSFAWQNEFAAFNKMAREDRFGLDVTLINGNVASRILPIKIHELVPEDHSIIEAELGTILRSIDFIYREPGVNRPLKPTDSRIDNQNKTDYRNQVNKVANAVKDLVTGIKQSGNKSLVGVKKDTYDRSSGRNLVFKKSAFIAGMLAVLILASFLIYHFAASGIKQDRRENKSIAVLYFNNMSGDQNQEYFCDGITEEIITKLSLITGLKVTSRTSVYQYKGEKKSTREIAKELGVTNILEGSLRKEDDKILVTAHLVDALSDGYIWSETYDRDLKDIFEVQSDIARHIASKFQIQLSKQEEKNIATPPTLNTQAYDKYLMAGSLAYIDWGLGARLDNLLKSIKLLLEAIQLDPNFSDAYLMLSWNYSYYSRDVENPKQWLDSAKMLARKVIHLNPSKAGGYDAMANAFWMEGNSQEALKWQLKSHEIEPYRSANMVSDYYRSMNEYGKAMTWLLEAIRHDTSEYKYYVAKAEIFYDLDMLDSMKLSLDKARRIKPDSYIDGGYGFNYYLFKDNLEEYERLSRIRYANFDKEFAYQMGIYYLIHRDWKRADSLYSLSSHSDDIDAGLAKIHIGDSGLGQKFLTNGIERRMHFRDFNGPWNMYDISRAYAAMTDNRYIEYLNIATGKKGWHVCSWFRRDPFFDSVRDTPAFRELARQMDVRNEKYKADLTVAMNKFYNKP
jgi:TolB-like protein